MLPTTLIDLKQNIIKQTHPYHEYTVLRREYMNLEIEKLVNAKARENLWNTQYVFYSNIGVMVKEKGSLDL